MRDIIKYVFSTLFSGLQREVLIYMSRETRMVISPPIVEDHFKLEELFDGTKTAGEIEVAMNGMCTAGWMEIADVTHGMSMYRLTGTGVEGVCRVGLVKGLDMKEIAGGPEHSILHNMFNLSNKTASAKYIREHHRPADGIDTVIGYMDRLCKAGFLYLVSRGCCDNTYCMTSPGIASFY